MRSPATLFLAALGMLLAAPSAFAYFDPTTGSLFLQLLLGGIAGLAVTVKLYWHKLLGLFHKKTEDDETEPQA